MTTALRLFLLTIFLCVSSSASPAQDPDADIIEKFIKRQATRLGGEEYGEARKVMAGDLNQDSQPDLAILYTIEGIGGGNNYTQFLAVFSRTKGRVVYVAHAVIGGKLNRAVELKSITNKVILFETLSYAANDGSCCPSVKGTAKFVLVGKKLKEKK